MRFIIIYIVTHKARRYVSQLNACRWKKYMWKYISNHLVQNFRIFLANGQLGFMKSAILYWWAVGKTWEFYFLKLYDRNLSRKSIRQKCKLIGRGKSVRGGKGEDGSRWISFAVYFKNQSLKICIILLGEL